MEVIENPNTKTASNKAPVRFLVDSQSIQLQLVEGTGTGKVMMRGEFARCDVATANKRVYPKKLWEREIVRLGRAMEGRCLFGELDHPGCLTSEDFRVLTVDGWKQFRDVQEGDKVWSRKEGKAVLSTVEGIIDHPYEGPVYQVTSRNINSTFTPGHRFLVRKRPDGTQYEDLSESYVALEEIVSNRGKYRHSAIPKTADFFSEGPEYIEIPAATSYSQAQHPVDVPLRLEAEVFAAFLGIYLAEGYVSSDRNRVYIAQKTDWTRDFIQNEVLSKFPKEMVWKSDEKGFYIADPRLHAYLAPLGDAYTKHLPTEAKKLGSRALKELVYWFSIGDGRFVSSSESNADMVEASGASSYKHLHAESLRESELGSIVNTRHDVFSVSHRLISDLHECVVRAGGSGSLSVVLPKNDYVFADHLIKAENKVPLYQLHISNSENIWLDPRSTKIEKVNHKGSIYCLTVTHGNFYIEQNGKAYWTGNSPGTELNRASHIITNLEVRDGIVVGEAQILDTERGRNLKAILEAGAKVGISSRGHGSVRMNERGEDVVQDDYRLVTFDFVADPADAHAIPEVFYEHKENQMERTEAEKAQDFALEVEKARKEGRQTAEDSLREEFEKEVLVRLGELRAEVTESVRKELLGDPEVALAKTALESIKSAIRPFVLPEDAKTVTEAKDAEIAKLQNQIAEQTLKIKELEEQNTTLEAVAKEAGYKFFVERSIAGDVDAPLIRDLIGDVTRYTSSKDLKETIVRVRTELVAKREEARKLKEQIEQEQIADQTRKEADRVRALKQEKALREENSQLRSALEKSVQANKEMGLQLYAEARLANHPKAGSIRPLIESAHAQTREEIDGIISQFREPQLDGAEIESVRARVRSVTRGGFSSTPLEEESPAQRSTSFAPLAHLGLGVDMADLKRLSGQGESRRTGK